MSKEQMLDDYKGSKLLAEKSNLTSEEIADVKFSGVAGDVLVDVLRKLIPKYFEESGASAKVLLAINKEIANHADK
jgi:hypothetical protein